MKKISHIITACLLVLSATGLRAQSQADGFASVSGKGLTTTTGGAGGTMVEVETLAHLRYYARTDRAYIIIVKGTIESETWEQVDVASNTTIVGYGTDATLRNIGLVAVDKENIVIRNLNIVDSYVEGDWEGKTNDNDGIRMDNTHHIWIDHCFLSRLGDGLIDLRKNSDYITVSYTSLNNHNKAFGIGWTEETNFHITIHHCWIDSTNQRNPSFDMGIGHLYNNYLSNITSYGNLSRGEARVIVQNSVFEKVKNPLSISGNATLYIDGNQLISCSGSSSGNTSVMPFNPADSYEYTLDAVSSVKNKVMEQSGPQNWVTQQYTAISANRELEEATKQMEFYVDASQHILYMKSAAETNAEVMIYAINGKLVKHQQVNLSGTTTLSLNDFKPGIYLVKFKMNNKIETGKFCIR